MPCRLTVIAFSALVATTAIGIAECRMPEKIEFRHPNGGEIFATFGYRRHPLLATMHHHDGVDYAHPIGDDIVASEAGTVLRAGSNGPFGNQVSILHRAGPEALETRYGHLTDQYVVKEGDCVEAGQVIGKMGSTGLSTGPHLHFEILIGAKFVDPMPLLPKR